MKALDDRDFYVQSSAASALLAISPNPEKLFVELLVGGRCRNMCVRDTLVAMGARVVPRLEKALSSPTVEDPDSITQTLGLIGKEGVRALVEAMSSNVPRVRSAAALGLVYAGSEAVEAAPALVRALRGKDKRLCREAAQVLGSIGPAAKEAIPALVEALSDPYPNVRARSAHSLAKIGKSSVPALVDALNSDDREARAYAAKALGGVGAAARSAVPALVRTMNDADDRVRYSSAEALGWIGPGAADAVPVLTSALADSNKYVRRFAAFALGRIGPKAAPSLAALLQIAENEAAESVLRTHAIEALGGIDKGGAKILPALLRLKNNRTSFVRGSVVLCLKELGPNAAPVVPWLVSALDDESFAVPGMHTTVGYHAMKALVAIGGAAVSALEEASKGGSVLQSERARRGLYLIGRMRRSR